MKSIRRASLFVLFGVGVGLGAPEIIAAQPFPHPQPERLAPPDRPPQPGLPPTPDGPPLPDVPPLTVRPLAPAHLPAPGHVAVPVRPSVPGRPPVPGHAGVVAPPPGGAHPRAPVVVFPGWPLKAAPRPVVVRPPQVVVRPFVPPRRFLPPVVFSGVAVSVRPGPGPNRGYSRGSLVWQGRVALNRADDWTEFSLNCNALGAKLWFEVIAGRVQADWAEVVYENGEAQVVEFPKRTVGPGMYPLLDMREGRRVDHVRMVAKTASREAKLTLWLAR